MSTFGEPMVYIQRVNIVYCDTLEQNAAKLPKPVKKTAKFY